MIRWITKLLPGPVRALARRVRDTVRKARWQAQALSEAKIERALRNFGAPQSGVLMVHSSLSACGYVQGGAATLVRALGAWAPGVTLAMPTHTYCYPEPSGNIPVFDVRQTPSVVGAVTEYFWRQPDVVRSVHPTHSVAARGPRAAELCAGHEQCTTPCGQGTPFEKLLNWDASVLMIGATLKAYTLFHTAGDAANCPCQYEDKEYELRALDKEGVLHHVRMFRQDMKVPRRYEAMDNVLEHEGLLRSGWLGLGRVLFIPSALAVHRFVLDQLAHDPYYLIAPSHRPQKVN